MSTLAVGSPSEPKQKQNKESPKEGEKASEDMATAKQERKSAEEDRREAEESSRKARAFLARTDHLIDLYSTNGAFEALIDKLVAAEDKEAEALQAEVDALKAKLPIGVSELSELPIGNQQIQGMQNRRHGREGEARKQRVEGDRLSNLFVG